jgi:hypothetical protein
MHSIEWYKAKYPCKTAEVNIRNDGLVELPRWMIKMFLDLSGVRSKKYRIQKKAIRRSFNRVLDLALGIKRK